MGRTRGQRKGPRKSHSHQGIGPILSCQNAGPCILGPYLTILTFTITLDEFIYVKELKVFDIESTAV